MRHARPDCEPGARWRAGNAGAPFGRGEFVRRRLFFRRFAIVAMFVVLLGLWGLFALIWTAAARFGVVDQSTPRIPFVMIASWFTGLALVAFLRIGRGIGVPLRAVMDAADRVAGGDYTTRVEAHGPPPVRALALAFNTMTERLERNDQQRRNLMADVAHELRTPLTVIQGRVEGLLDGVYPRDDAGLELVLEETRVLSRLIEDLRTLALSEAGALNLEKEPTDLPALARDVAQAFAGEAAARQMAIDVRAEPAPPIEIDPVRIREVLTNLVSNALRHSVAGGTITLDVSRISPDSSPTAVTVSVSDTGAGMSAEEAQQAFGRFYKGADSRGSGLGLAIAHGLVVAHGGKIHVVSEQGRGTTITFTLPGSLDPFSRRGD
jgi:signal transduction histidine kinase